jgi:hypothetical protein
MLLTLKVATVFLASIAMALSMAHALELPGKLRLDKQAYLTVQPIYYPGFTVGGFSEILGILATGALLYMTSTSGGVAFSLTIGALIALIAMHAAYWIITHPVNNFWVKDEDLKGVGAGFFAFGAMKRPASNGAASDEGWKGLRNRWEFSHVLRAVLAVVALILLIIAVAT